MIGFFKKLFGRDADTNKEAGVQIEQVPYKVETPVVEPVKVTVAEVAVPEVKSAPAVITAPKKKGAPKKQGGAKPKTARKPKQPK
jgi:SepF-like predicted cell division protein (DUF552 family)